MVGKYKGRGLIQTVGVVFRNNGIRGFWRGTLISMGRLIPHQSIYFFCLNYFHNLLIGGSFGETKKTRGKIKQKGLKYFVVGGVARTVAVVLTTPLLVMKTNIESVETPTFSSARVALDNIRKRGIAWGFRGLGTSLIRNVPYGGLFFTLYSALLPRIRVFPNSENSRYSSLNVMLCSGISSVCIHFILHPFDVLRTRIMLQGKSLNLISGFRDIYSKEGITGIWRGTLPKIAKKSIATSVAWTLYNSLLQ